MLSLFILDVYCMKGDGGMFTYFTPHDLFIYLIFPLITAIIPIILTYFLFEPIIELIKKNLTKLDK